MGLRFDPIGGGQFKQAVKSIIEAESQPLKQLQQRKGLEEAKMKTFQEFKTKFTGFEKTLAEFSNFQNFRELKVDLGDGANVMSVTVDKAKAEPGSYNIQVDQLAARTSVISNGFEDPEDPVLGVGFIVVNKSDGTEGELYVDEKNSSLRGVANLINRQPDSPIRASVIQDGSDKDRPWRLILTAKNDGIDDEVSFPDFYFLDGKEDIYLDDENDAKNAIIKLDGFPIEAQSNDLPEFLSGVNVKLKQAKPDQPFTLTITEDHQKISGKVKGLVDQINGILEFINKQNQVDDKTDTRTTFAGDSGLQTVEYRIRNLLHEGFPAGTTGEGGVRFVHLNQIGIEFTKTGSLSFKEDKFTSAMEKDFEGVAEAITGEYGFASQVRQVMGQYTRVPDGMLATRETGMRNRIKKIDVDIENKERRLLQRQDALTAQFARLQSSLAGLQQQSAYLQANLGGGGGNNLVSQLLGG